MRVIPRALRMHQIEIEIIYATGGKLALEEGANVRFALEEIRR